MMRSHRFILAILMSIVAILALFSVSAISAHAEEAPAAAATETAAPAEQTTDTHIETKNFLLDTKHFDKRLDDSNLPIHVTVGNYETPTTTTATPDVSNAAAEDTDNGFHKEMTLGFNDGDLLPVVILGNVLKTPVVIGGTALTTAPIAFTAGALTNALPAAITGFVPGVVTGALGNALPAAITGFVPGVLTGAVGNALPAGLTGAALNTLPAALTGAALNAIPAFITGALANALPAFNTGLLLGNLGRIPAFVKGALANALPAGFIGAALNAIPAFIAGRLSKIPDVINAFLFGNLGRIPAFVKGALANALPAAIAGFATAAILGRIGLGIVGALHALANPLSFGSPLFRILKGFVFPIPEIIKDHLEDLLALGFVPGLLTGLVLAANVATPIIAGLAFAVPTAFTLGSLLAIPALLTGLVLGTIGGLITAAVLGRIGLGILGALHALANPLSFGDPIFRMLKGFAFPLLEIFKDHLEDLLLASVLGTLAALPLLLLRTFLGTGFISIVLRLIFNAAVGALLALTTFIPFGIFGTVGNILIAVATAFNIALVELAFWGLRVVAFVTIVLGTAVLGALGIGGFTVGAVIARVLTMPLVIGVVVASILGVVAALLVSLVTPLPILLTTLLALGGAILISGLALNVWVDILLVDIAAIITGAVIYVKALETEILVGAVSLIR